jgi:hypothetical protein
MGDTYDHFDRYNFPNRILLTKRRTDPGHVPTKGAPADRSC